MIKTMIQRIFNFFAMVTIYYDNFSVMSFYEPPKPAHIKELKSYRKK